MTAQDNQIEDGSNDHAYFAMMPNMLDDLLDPYQYRLYAHIKRVCGEKGKCWQSTETIAKACRMSTGKVSEVKNELHLMGLIIITYKHRPSGGSPYHIIKVVDIWPRNMAHCIAGSSGEQAGSQSETKKTPLKEDPKEGGATAPHAPADESWPTEPAVQEPEPPRENPADRIRREMRSRLGEDVGTMVLRSKDKQKREGTWTVPEYRGLSPANAVVKEATGYSPIKAARHIVDEAIPNDLDALELWGKVCKGWILSGNKYSNIGGMLDWYAEGKVSTKPKANGGHNNNGAASVEARAEYIYTEDNPNPLGIRMPTPEEEEEDERRNTEFYARMSSVQGSRHATPTA